MAKLELELQRAGRKPELICVESERVLIGSEAYCDVRLPIDEASPEQLLLEVTGQGLRVTALSATPPLLVEGQRAARSLIASGTRLGLGKLVIRVWLDRGGTGLASSKRSLVQRLALIGGPLALIALGAFIVLADGAKARGKAAAPPLWTDGAGACPAKQPREALEVASEKRELAEAKAQRQPFVAREGVEAVRLYGVAAECARAAGASELHAELDATADSLQNAIDLDYRVRRLRLDYSLKIGDKRTAAREVSMLRELLRGNEGAYTRWLAALEVRLRGSEGRLLSSAGGALP